MEKSAVLDALAGLAQETRLDIYRLLVPAGAAGLAAGRIAQALGLPAATLSFHLAHLRQAGLVGLRREGRSLIYAADYAAMNGLIAFLAENCCGRPACVPACDPLPASESRMRTPYNVLFLCTGNSARSILAESLLNHLGGGRFRAFSAGSFPSGAVRPEALALLREQGLPTEGLRSKSWNEFAAPGAPEMDFVFTVCDQAAGETCPLWPGHPVTAHWGIPDPAGATGSQAVVMLGFRAAARALETRIRLFLALPVETLDPLALHRETARIGQSRVGEQA